MAIPLLNATWNCPPLWRPPPPYHLPAWVRPPASVAPTAPRTAAPSAPAQPCNVQPLSGPPGAGRKEGRKKGNVLFNDALNTFHLRLYGVRHMIEDHSESEIGNLLPPQGLLFLTSSKGSFICIIPQTGLTHTTAFVTQVVKHWLEWKPGVGSKQKTSLMSIIYQ